jgi:hypothetical protein
MAEKPSLRQILEMYYALRAAGVQRFPKPLAPTKQVVERTPTCLFLIDFVSPDEHLTAPSVERQNLPALLRRLLERLPWRDGVNVHTVFATPPKSPVVHPIAEGVVEAAFAAFENTNARRCVCFGWRAAQVAGVVLGVPFAVPPEAYEPVTFEREGEGVFELLVLPDLRELEAFPEWRGRVWESLMAFGPLR